MELHIVVEEEVSSPFLLCFVLLTSFCARRCVLPRLGCLIDFLLLASSPLFPPEGDMENDVAYAAV